MVPAMKIRGLPLVVALVAGPVFAADSTGEGAPEVSASATGYYYAMRDQPDFGVGVAALDRGALHLEARYNYEARDAASAFVGWKFAGGDGVTYEVTPIVGALFGAARGFVPGLEAGVNWRAFDAYVVEIEPLDGDDAGKSTLHVTRELPHQILKSSMKLPAGMGGGTMSSELQSVATASAAPGD